MHTDVLNLDSYEERTFHEAIVTKYYHFGTQRVALRREAMVYYEGRTGYYDSGHLFDAAGAALWLGAVPDAVSCVFNFFSWRFYFTP